VDAPILCIPRAMKAGLIARSVWNIFKQRMSNAFIVLRRNASMITCLARAFFRDICDDSTIQKCIMGALKLAKDDEMDAVASFLLDLELSVLSFRKYLKNQLHSYNVDRITSAAASVSKE
jgi:hypothetical protein